LKNSSKQQLQPQPQIKQPQIKQPQISKINKVDSSEIKKAIKDLSNEELAAVVRSSFGSEDAASELLKKLNEEKLTAKILPTLTDTDISDLKLKLGTKKALQELIKAAKENKTVEIKVKVSKDMQQPAKEIKTDDFVFNSKVYDSDMLCHTTQALDIVTASSSGSSGKKVKRVALKTAHGTFITVRPNGSLFAVNYQADTNEILNIEKSGNYSFIKCANGKYLSVDVTGKVSATADIPKQTETFDIGSTRMEFHWVIANIGAGMRYLSATPTGDIITTKECSPWEAFEVLKF